MAAKLEKLLRIFAYLMGKDYFCIRFYTMGFRSSVGLEQQPSKLWVLGSNPNGITIMRVCQNRHTLLCVCNVLRWLVGENHLAVFALLINNVDAARNSTVS